MRRGAHDQLAVMAREAVRPWVVAPRADRFPGPNSDGGRTDYSTADTIDGQLRSMCWCERTTVWVPAAMVRAGLTRACQHPECLAQALENNQREDQP
jgi:hypothetical protein